MSHSEKIDGSLKIYYRPLKQWIPVTAEEKRNWEREINTYRKAKQRAGTCCLPHCKYYLCDTDCDICKFKCRPLDAPSWLSIEEELDRASEHGISHRSILADPRLTTNLDLDIVVLKRVLDDIRTSDPESYQILMLVAAGVSEREAAECMQLARNTYVYRRNILFAKIRTEYF